MSFTDDNIRQTARLRKALNGITPAQWGRDIGGGWTVGTMACHLAFWDTMTLARLRKWKNTGKLTAVPDADNIEVINESVRIITSAVGLPGGPEYVIKAAEEIDAFVAGLTPADLKELDATGRERWYKRSAHRGDHLPRIEGGLKKT